MMLYVTIIRASEYLIISDTNITPYHLTKKFENARYRLLHDRLVEFFNKLQAQQMYHPVTEIMQSYINKQQKSKGVDPTVDEIKLLLVTDIIKKYKIGDFHIGMLDLAKEYDDRLLSHWTSLAQYTMDQLKKSVNQEIEDYQFLDIAINKSVSFIWFLCAELLYEIVILQMDLNRWAWRKCSAFDCLIYELIPRIRIDYDFIVKKDGCIYTELHFDPINLFTMKPNIIDAYVLLRRNHELPMDILVVYGYYEIQDVCRRNYDLNNPPTNKPMGNIEMLKHTFLVDKNMYKIQVVACSLFANGYINDADSNVCLSLPPIYLLFARQELGLSACYKIERWRESHLLAAKEFGLASKLINLRLQLKYDEELI